MTQFRHRHREFLTFLRMLAEPTPAELAVHVIPDDTSSRLKDEVGRWFRRHARFQLPRVPTGSSWLKAGDGWASKFTRRTLLRGSFRNVPSVKRAIDEHGETSNENVQPFVRTKDAETTRRKVRRIRRRSGTVYWSAGRPGDVSQKVTSTQFPQSYGESESWTLM